MASPNTDEIFSQALQLPCELRAKLASQLCDSLASETLTQPSISAAWLEECRMRIQESDSGLPGIPLEEVLSKLDDRQHARHQD